MCDMGSDVTNLVDELIDRGILAMHTHEANVGNGIEVAKMLPNVPPDLFRRGFSIVMAEQVFLDVVHQESHLCV